MSDELMRHIAACNNAELPGRRWRFRIGEAGVGWVLPDLAAVLSEFASVTVREGCVTLDPAAAGGFPGMVRELAARGLCRWRNEAFDVRAEPEGAVLTQIDRGALPLFGVLAQGVHVNGLVRPPGGGVQLWIARRAADKALDPGKLDHIVAGGCPAGLSHGQTLVKEAAEEASIPADLAAQAVPVAAIGYAMERPEGLRRDLLHCYDLDLPPDFTPIAADGEVEGFELWPIERALEAVRRTDDFKFNVNLVLIDLFLRLGLIAGPEAGSLRPALG